MKGTITVLQHTVVYDTKGITLDESALDVLHDVVLEGIAGGESKGVAELYLEDAQENSIDVDVEWCIVDWQYIAEKLYTNAEHLYITYGEEPKGYQDVIDEFEELVKLTAK